MAQYYANVSGSRGTEVTKTGTKQSGMSAHIRGWDTGVKVELSHVNGEDVVKVYRTGGSNRNHDYILIAQYTQRTPLPVLLQNNS